MTRFDPSRLKAIRKPLKITAAALARRLGVSAVQIHRLENGQRRLTVDALLAYCQALDISPAYLLATNLRVPITGEINSEFQIESLPPGTATHTLSPPLVVDMSSLAALRWAASGRFQPMKDHIVFYQRGDAPEDGEHHWNLRCLISRADHSQCLGWPIKDGDRAHIDTGSGPAEYSVEIIRTEPVVAVVAPFAIANLEKAAALL